MSVMLSAEATEHRATDPSIDNALADIEVAYIYVLGVVVVNGAFGKEPGTTVVYEEGGGLGDVLLKVMHEAASPNGFLRSFGGRLGDAGL